MPGNDDNSWFQVDFGNWTKVTMISTQGSPFSWQWVTRYLVTYSYDGLFYKDYSKVTTCHLDLLKIIFTGQRTIALYSYNDLFRDYAKVIAVCLKLKKKLEMIL